MRLELYFASFMDIPAITARRGNCGQTNLRFGVVQIQFYSTQSLAGVTFPEKENMSDILPAVLYTCANALTKIQI